MTVTIPPVTPTGTLPVSPAATILLTAVAIVAHPATGPFTDHATAGASTATSAGLALVSPPTTYAMAKTANPTLNVPAGTDVAYAITATPTAPANPSPAYDVTITDTLPAGFTLDKSTDLASAVTDNSASGCAGTMATPTLVGQLLTMSWAGPVPATCALSVAYSGVFAASASVTSVNTANPARSEPARCRQPVDHHGSRRYDAGRLPERPGQCLGVHGGPDVRLRRRPDRHQSTRHPCPEGDRR